MAFLVFSKPYSQSVGFTFSSFQNVIKFESLSQNLIKFMIFDSLSLVALLYRQQQSRSVGGGWRKSFAHPRKIFRTSWGEGVCFATLNFNLPPSNFDLPPLIFCSCYGSGQELYTLCYLQIPLQFLRFVLV